MSDDIKIYEIKILSDGTIDELAQLLIDTVNDGASIGFLTPMCKDKARNYWLNVLDNGIYLFVAKVCGEVVGTIQLRRCLTENGRHRGEVCRLMVNPNLRGRGIGKSLLSIVEDKARTLDISLLILDAREGDISNALYRSFGFVDCGKIPNYALSINGELDATVIYYKNI